MPTGHDELKEQQGWVTRALNAEARVEGLEKAAWALIYKIPVEDEWTDEYIALWNLAKP